MYESPPRLEGEADEVWAPVDKRLGEMTVALLTSAGLTDPLAGLPKVSVIHGLGTGALRDAVRNDAGAHPLVRTIRAGDRGEGGDGVTVVELA